MRRTIHVILFITLFCFLLSCDDEESGSMATAPVSNITYTAYNGAILFHWDNPKIDNLAYVEISYSDKTGITRRCLAKGGLTDQLIEGLPDNNPYSFRFLAYNTGGKVSEPIDIMAAALESTINLFYGRVKLSVAFSGVNVSWENEFPENFYIELKYTDLNGNNFNEEVVVAANSIGKQLVKIGSTLTGSQSLDIYATIVDENGNISDSKVLKFYKKEAGKLSRTKWTVLSSSPSQSDAPVQNVLDGDSKTMWHSRWSSNKVDFPHWFILDLGAKKNLEKVGIQQREAAQLLKGVAVYGNNITGNPSDESQWTLIHEFDVAVSPAEQVFTFPDVVTYRYIKMLFTTPCGTDGGDNMCAGFVELNFYGSDVVDE